MKVDNMGRFRFIGYLISILGLILVINGLVKTYEYAKFYNESPEIIFEQHKDMNKFLYRTMSIKDDSILELSHALFSGNKTIAKIKSIKDTNINIKLIKKTGKAKILLWEVNQKTAILKELSQNEEVILIKSGEYQVIFLGQFFTGRVILDLVEGEIQHFL